MLLGWWQENFGRRQELYVRNFCNDAYALKLAFFSAAGGWEGQEILIVEVLVQFIEVRF
jgi:hypothetical protein